MLHFFAPNEAAQLNAGLIDLKEKMGSSPFSTVKKRVLISAIDYMLGRVNTANVFKQLTTDVEARLAQIQEMYKLADTAMDDEFINGIKQIINRLDNGSELKTHLSVELASAEKDLAIRRHNIEMVAILSVVMLAILAKSLTDSTLLTCMLATPLYFLIFNKKPINEIIEFSEVVIPLIKQKIEENAVRANQNGEPVAAPQFNNR